jgi:subtilisin family serine protease
MAHTLIGFLFATALCAVFGIPVMQMETPFMGNMPHSFFNSSGDIIPGEYIVSLKPGASLWHNIAAVEAEVKTKSGEDRVFKVMDDYEIGDYQGYAANFDANTARDVAAMEGVASVEPNRKVYASFESSKKSKCAIQKESVWGLVRTNEQALKLNGLYTYNSDGYTSVDAYVIDTGIYLQHEDFEGKAVWGFDAFPNSKKTDGNGHGTHVAGTIGGKLWGLAKDVKLVAVRVLDDDGSGTNAGVIAGIEYAANAAKKSKRPSVANLSLGGGFSAAMNDAVNAAVKSGLHMVVAAGNSYYDACFFSPASADDVLTVGSTTNTDAMSSFSNFGDCVDIFAPGSAITSTWIGGKSATNTISGTSMASPHVAGVVAKVLAAQPKLTPAQMIKLLKDTSTKGAIKGLDTASPNEIVYHKCA